MVHVRLKTPGRRAERIERRVVALNPRACSVDRRNAIQSAMSTRSAMDFISQVESGRLHTVYNALRRHQSPDVNYVGETPLSMAVENGDVDMLVRRETPTPRAPHRAPSKLPGVGPCCNLSFLRACGRRCFCSSRPTRHQRREAIRLSCRWRRRTQRIRSISTMPWPAR